MSIRRITSAAFLFLSLVCGLKNPSIASTFGYGTFSNKWKTHLRVCFIDDETELKNPRIAFKQNYENIEDEQIIPLDPTLRKDIIQAVTLSFQKTPIRFSGWRTCSQTKNPDVVVFYSEDPAANFFAGSIGDPSLDLTLRDKTINSVRLNKAYFGAAHRLFDQIDQRLAKAGIPFKNDEYRTRIRNQQILAGVVHEFGHIVGLHHEHFREDGDCVIDALDPSLEHTVAQDFKKKRDELKSSLGQNFEKSVKATAIGMYDILSNMNYFRDPLSQVAYAMDQICTRYPSTLCNQKAIDFILPHADSERGYFSSGDIETINAIYRNQPPSNQVYKTVRSSLDWFRSVIPTYKELIRSTEPEEEYRLF